MPERLRCRLQKRFRPNIGLFPNPHLHPNPISPGDIERLQVLIVEYPHHLSINYRGKESLFIHHGFKNRRDKN
jgi:hypothetical protein